jgi:two-component system OmpR family response regulator
MLNKKVLIVDDENDFGHLLGSFLSRRGYDVHLSHTLREGMQALDELHPDVMILDNNLPDGLGWEKTEFILTKQKYIKLILISAYHHDPTITQKFPEVKIFEKPINLAELNKYLS